MSSLILIPETTPLKPGVLSQFDISVPTGDQDLYVFAPTTVTLPDVANPTAIAAQYATLTEINPCEVVIASQTFVTDGAGFTITPGPDDWLPQSASLGDGVLVLGPKTSTDTYPPKILTPQISGLGGLTTPSAITTTTTETSPTAIPTISAPSPASEGPTANTFALPTVVPSSPPSCPSPLPSNVPLSIAVASSFPGFTTPPPLSTAIPSGLLTSLIGNGSFTGTVPSASVVPFTGAASHWSTPSGGVSLAALALVLLRRWLW